MQQYPDPPDTISEETMNVGLFGGTFNPIHNGHIAVITHVKEIFGLDRVHLIPSAVPPHKPTTNLAPALDRFQMVAQAVQPVPGLTVSDIELKRKGRSFSVDTIKQFKKRTGARADLFFILGTDAFFDMETWKGTRDIFQASTPIVMTRAGDNRKLKEIESFLQLVISSGYACTSLHGNSCDDNSLSSALKSSTGTCTFANCNPDFRPVHICKVPEIQISSTGIRERIGSRQSVKGLVPDSVEAIIIKKGLYFDKGK